MPWRLRWAADRGKQRGISQGNSLRNGGLALAGIGLGSTGVLAQAVAPATHPGNLDALVSIVSQLGGSGFLALLAWFLYQDNVRMKAEHGDAMSAAEKKHGETLATERKAHGDAMTDSAEAHAKAVAAINDLRLEEAAGYAAQLEQVRQEQAAERQQLFEASVKRPSPRPPRNPTAKKKRPTAKKKRPTAKKKR